MPLENKLLFMMQFIHFHVDISILVVVQTSNLKIKKKISPPYISNPYIFLNVTVRHISDHKTQIILFINFISLINDLCFRVKTILT